MLIKSSLIALASATALLTLPGCAVVRDQSSVGQYVDDTTITTQIKARMVENKQVDAGAISVETLNGTVLLSGFAKSAEEKAMAHKIAHGVNGVKSVRNEIAIRAK
ncbi:BON domain-containing protein [Piscinibacter sakaiensis]|uniref:BON domain-containing protein n=1 Tax=Piscinibacter sakaiensis TaxID=1547922 RepID=UPI003AB041E3